MSGLSFAQAQANYDNRTPDEPTRVSQAWWNAECRKRAPKYLANPAWVLAVLNGGDIAELSNSILAPIAQATAVNDQPQMGLHWATAFQQIAEWAVGSELGKEGYAL